MVSFNSYLKFKYILANFAFTAHVTTISNFTRFSHNYKPKMQVRYAVLIMMSMLWECGASTTGLQSQVIVNFAGPSLGPLKHFWTSTGLCPPEPHSEAHKFLLSADELLNIALISALPNNAITHVRIHWLLDLISIRMGFNYMPNYNWTHLDSLMDWLHAHKLLPGFELMGNPSQVFNDLENATQAALWQNMISKLATRYIERYSAEEVSRWRFETWNEPDLRSYNTLHFTLAGFLHYFNACAEGLHEASSIHGPTYHMKLGGPAGLFKVHKKHPLCWGLLEHCASSNLTHCPLDFISFHKKGGGSGAAILHQGVQLIQNIHKLYPTLRTIPIANDEADPMTGWSQSESWRADVRYGAMVARVILDHQRVMVRHYGMALEVLSNDNGFMNYHPYYFSQRTLLTRFQMNNTNPPHLQFFRKPIYVTMALMSFLGDTELKVKVKNKTHETNVWLFKRLSVMSASINQGGKMGSWNAAVLLTFSNDSKNDPLTVANISLVLKNLPVHNGNSLRYTILLLNNSDTNPSSIWKAGGMPVFPSRDLRCRMRAAEGPLRLVPVSKVPDTGQLRLSLHLSLPSIALVHVCAQAKQPPGQVTHLEAFNVTFDEILLVWSDTEVVSRCIKTYEVEYSPKTIQGPKFVRINVEDTIFLSYQYVASDYEAVSGSVHERVRGIYRVRAIDYWERGGQYSQELLYA